MLCTFKNLCNWIRQCGKTKTSEQTVEGQRVSKKKSPVTSTASMALNGRLSH